MIRLRKSCRLGPLLAAIFACGSPLRAQNCATTGAENGVVKPVERGSESNLPHADVTELRLGPGDLLEIKVFGQSELSDTLRVGNNGEITMPLAGAMKVAGETVEEAQKQIERRLLSGGFLRDPHVNILVKEFASQGISVLGEVARPGIYPLLGPRTLFDAIAAAGGTTNRAGRTVVITHRNPQISGEAATVVLSKDPKETAKQNLELHPGDTVMVSKAGIVYVSGDVKNPGGFLLDSNENLTVLQAIALAQGLNPTAAGGNVRIIRRNSGKLEDIPVGLKQIMEAKSPDIPLENEDVLFVPNSASKSAARKSLESIVQVATGLAIYRR
jgi:polysaccharide export outer membrane protein